MTRGESLNKLARLFGIAFLVHLGTGKVTDVRVRRDAIICKEDVPDNIP